MGKRILLKISPFKCIIKLQIKFERKNLKAKFSSLQIRFGQNFDSKDTIGNSPKRAFFGLII